MKSGVNFNKYSKIPVKVTDPNNNSPKPITSFQSAGLNDLLLKNIEQSGYTEPTPIQKYGIPIILVSISFHLFSLRKMNAISIYHFSWFHQAKRDLMACAQTGSGKTAAFLLPIIQTLIQEQAPCKIGNPYAVIVSPTRELAIQVKKIEIHSS